MPEGLHAVNVPMYSVASEFKAFLSLIWPGKATAIHIGWVGY